MTKGYDKQTHQEGRLGTSGVSSRPSSLLRDLRQHGVLLDPGYSDGGLLAGEIPFSLTCGESTSAVASSPGAFSRRMVDIFVLAPLRP